MVQEYLIKDNKIAEHIKDYSSDIIKQEISEKYNSQILSITMIGENENNAKTLSIIHEEIISENEVIVLNDGRSEYFNKLLFPLVNEFERKLRKLLYVATALSDNNEIKGIENIKNLEDKELGPIFDMLFTDIEFNTRTRALAKEISYQYDKKSLINYIDSIDEDTLWKRILENKIEYFSENYIKVKDARNAVMHARNINYLVFGESRKLFKKVNKEIDDWLSEISKPEQKVIIDFKDFNIRLAEALKQNAIILSNAMKPVEESLKKLALFYELMNTDKE